MCEQHRKVKPLRFICPVWCVISAVLYVGLYIPKANMFSFEKTSTFYFVCTYSVFNYSSNEAVPLNWSFIWLYPIGLRKKWECHIENQVHWMLGSWTLALKKRKHLGDYLVCGAIWMQLCILSQSDLNYWVSQSHVKNRNSSISQASGDAWNLKMSDSEVILSLQ